MQSYEMNDTLEFSKEGVNDVINFIEKSNKYYIVKDTQDNKILQKADVDLIIIDIKDIPNNRTRSVEVKTDRCYYTGNYFFETISNTIKNTPGCFLCSKADDFYYYFQNEKELHIIPLKEARDWFLKNQDKFQTKYTSTKSINGTILYNTEGKIVPRDIVLREVKGIKIKKINN